MDTGYIQGLDPPCPRAVAALHEPAREHSRECPCLHWACRSCRLPCSASPCCLDAADRVGSTLAVAFEGPDIGVGVLKAVVVGMLQGLERLVGQLAAGVVLQVGPCSLLCWLQ